MEIHQLTYFVAVAETGNFTRAAERCNVAQPSLSQQIIKLENELGQPLFDRLGRKVVLTDAGRALLPRANTILAELQGIRRGIDREIESGQGTLAVGFIPTMAPFVLPGVIKRFSQRFPDANLVVHENLTEALVGDIINGKLDIGITSLPIHNKLIQTRELLTEPLVVASSRRYDLITRASIKVQELDDFPFIALNEVHCLGEQVQSFCYQQDLNVNIVCYASQLSTVQNCIALGLGVSLVPQALAVQDDSGQIAYRTLTDAVPQRKIAAVFHARRALSFLGGHLIEMVSEEYHASCTIKLGPG
ncbi:MAG: LysR substrate-binding domain-containing protein [Anaerolineales bacterium]|nr:LysR substrate-binding domain-containing protein [Anaerolineales bacterium]